MQAHAVWKGGYETELDDGRGHRVTVDVPREDGGTDKGASAHELLILSLTGCITTIFHMIAERRKLDFTSFTLSLSAERGRGSATVRRVHGTAVVRTAAPPEDVDTVLRLAVKGCPVGALFDRAHIPVNITLRVEPPGPEVRVRTGARTD